MGTHLTQKELSNEYQHERVTIVYRNHVGFNPLMLNFYADGS